MISDPCAIGQYRNTIGEIGVAPWALPCPDPLCGSKVDLVRIIDKFYSGSVREDEVSVYFPFFFFLGNSYCHILFCVASIVWGNRWLRSMTGSFDPRTTPNRLNGSSFEFQISLLFELLAFWENSPFLCYLAALTMIISILIVIYNVLWSWKWNVPNIPFCGCPVKINVRLENIPM